MDIRRWTQLSTFQAPEILLYCRRFLMQKDGSRLYTMLSVWAGSGLIAVTGVSALRVLHVGAGN